MTETGEKEKARGTNPSSVNLMQGSKKGKESDELWEGGQKKKQPHPWVVV